MVAANKDASEPKVPSGYVDVITWKVLKANKMFFIHNILFEIHSLFKFNNQYPQVIVS
jgi:hypothetical protein